MTETTTLPIPPDTLLIIAALLGIGIVSYITFLVMPKERDPKRGNPLARVGDSLGFRVERFDTAALLVVIFFIYFIIFFLAAIIALRALGGILFLPLPEVLTPTQTRTGLAFGTLLAAILGAPLIVWRSWVAQKTAAIAEESLFNDKINAAATDLAARRQVTRVVKDKDGIETVLTEWEDDLVTRAAAIDRLEGLAIEAMERDDYPPAQRIARMLSIYVRELSEIHGPQQAPHRAGFSELRAWAVGLSGYKRRDVERAAQALGKINPREKSKRKRFDPSNIDLERSNLQGCNLKELNYSGATLSLANLHGANFTNSLFDGAGLDFSHFWFSNLLGASFLDADLGGAEFNGANLSFAKFSDETEIDETVFHWAAASYLGSVSLFILQEHWDVIFADGNSTCPKPLRPNHWVTEELEFDDFQAAWRAWAATLDPPVTIAPDYRP